ncbi:hypothetical protein CPB84DRAFT_1960309 [Gymnopilus junonius]|uniref:DUF6697 domain-containing protein n=1 Tax=Gymnopilus junonius TaxID=109634 RepID=A0A9P5NQT0_GYMJU|nr:hypothetical protein CPB84DRAFT_1960309 [Gymnopilus junonius]
MKMATPDTVHNEEPEVIVIKDELQEVETTALRALENGKKNGRMVVEVVVDTYANFLKRKKEDLEKVKKLINPKAQKIEKMKIKFEHVMDRLGSAALDAYPIALDLATLEATVSRAFMSSTYGGNMQMTFPNIGDEHLAKHGLNDFMYLNTLYQPNAPQVPGCSGLFFDTEIDSRWPGKWRVFTRLSSGAWLFVGFYEVNPTRPLTKEDWASLDPQVQRTWAYQIRKKSWGGYFCARVVARQELGRKPTRAEWMGVFNDKRHLRATPEDIRRSLATGEEQLAVSTMKCVGYDEDFQRRLCEQEKRSRRPKNRS